MEKQRKIPLRKCIVTQEQLPKKELIRIVRNKENEVFIDTTGKQNGRGAYIQLKADVIKKAQAKKLLDRHLDTNVSDDIYDELLKMVESNG